MPSPTPTDSKATSAPVATTPEATPFPTASTPVTNSPTTKCPGSTGTIVDVAIANGSFTTLVGALEAYGLVDLLSSDGPFTVFGKYCVERYHNLYLSTYFCSLIIASYLTITHYIAYFL